MRQRTLLTRAHGLQGVAALRRIVHKGSDVSLDGSPNVTARTCSLWTGSSTMDRTLLKAMMTKPPQHAMMLMVEKMMIKMMVADKVNQDNNMNDDGDGNGDAAIGGMTKVIKVES
eukprot:scaffold185700_cov18-Tisochrysis_lutea.AAC.1